jgi:uncharacterized DUF497 family protein
MSKKASGVSLKEVLISLVVVFAERIASIRIISARKANQRETRFYEQQPRPL